MWASAARAHVVLNTAFAAMVVLVVAALLPHGVFWGPDSGNRFIQLQSFDRAGLAGIAIAPSAAQADPQRRFFPTGGHHFQKVGGEIYSFYSPLFAAFVLPLFRALGAPSLLLVPAIAGILLVMFFAQWVRGSSRLALFVPIVVLVATPLLFYSVVFWEHTLAAALSLAAVVLVARSDQPRPSVFLLGGVTAGCAALLREETYILIGALFAASLSTRSFRPLLFAAGAAAAIVPLWLLNARLYGHPLGLHAAVYNAMVSTGSRIAEAASNVPVYLFEFGTSRLLNVVLALPAVALFLLAFARAAPAVDRARAVVALSGGLTAIGSVVVLHAQLHPYEQTLYTQGLFTAVPLAMLAFLSPREGWEENKGERRVAITVALALAGTCLALNQRDFGIIWGPRHFLAVIPLLLFLALRGVERFSARADAATRRLLNIAIVCIVAASAAIQAHGVRVLHSKLRFSSEVVERIRSMQPSVVVTDVFWIPEDLASLFYETPVLEVRTDAELKELAANLTRSGEGRFIFVASRKFRRISQEQFRALMPYVRERVRINGGEPILDVMIMLIELSPRRNNVP